MKRALLFTTIGMFIFAVSLKAQPNIFNPADPIVPYNSASPPSTNWGNIQKWVVTNRSLGWTTSSYKSYHFNGISFRVKFPKTYQHNVADGKKYPVMLFFHGAGEKGSIYDNELQLLHGGELFRDRVNNGQFDGFLIYPQNTNGFFGNTYYGPMIQVLDSLAKYCKLDVDKVFANGLSAGGSATFEITAGYPHRITKAAPSAAASTGLIPYIPSFVHVPIWFASGDLDNNPTPFMAKKMYDSLKSYGADVRWTLYADQGHFVWYSHWQETDFLPYMNDMHKANPLVYFQRNLFCPDSPTNARMGVSPGFFAYQWAVDNGSGYTTIGGATSNEYTATAYGTYRVRFKRTSTSDWSDWSPKPVTVGPKTTTITPPLTVKGLRSKVLPAPDGSTTVPLRLPTGFAGYEYWRVSDNTIVKTDSIYDAPVGVYKGRVKEQFGCNAFFSPDFTVIPANGINKPDAAKNLTAFGLSQSSMELNWSDNPNAAFNETGFEIYRGTTTGGPYTLIAITGPDVLTYLDQNLPHNTTFFYLVRAVNNTSAAPSNSNEASGTTRTDNNVPTAPGNLRATLVGRFSVTLKWDASTDDAGVSKYDIYMNGAKLFTTDQTTFVVNELDSFKRYVFAVRAKDVSGNLSPFSNQINITTKMQGLFYEYYEGSWTQVPDFDALGTPQEVGNTATADISVRNRNDNFAMIWRGYIKVPTTSTYTFETCSNDGSKLYINTPYSDDATALVTNDFLRGSTTCQTGAITLVAGVQYPITITYFEATGSSETMQVWWRNSSGLSRQQIPSSAFTETFTPSGSAPTAPTGLGATASGYDRITLNWTDASSNETGFELVRATAAAGPFVNIGTTAAGATSFIDSTRNPATTYWYKVRAIGLNGESAFSSTASATTQAAPPAPAAPTVLSANGITTSSINLSWNDNSNNETLFEIYRSTGNNANFRLITTVTGGAGATKNYSDAGLFANLRYYYKVRAAGVGGNSAYTNEVNGKTLNTKPVLQDVIDFTVSYSAPYDVQINATDPDGDVLTFSSPNLPPYATIEPGTNGTATVHFTPDIGDQGGNVIVIIVNDGNGGKDTTYLNMLINENQPPALPAIADIAINEGAVQNIPLLATDAEDASLIGWSFTGLPSFVSFSHNGSGTGNLHVAPGYAASGVYNVQLRVDDGYGAWIMRPFKIIVSEKDPNEKILVSIKNATTAPAPWNNMGSTSISNLKNIDGNTTAVGAAVQNSWQFNLSDQGAQTGDNSGVYPDAVMKDGVYWGYFLGNNTIDTSILNITGLNPARKYTLSFFGSSIYNLYPDNGTTKYQVGATTVSVGVQNNTGNKASINDISPTAGGVISVKMIGDAHPDLGGWLNAFEIINQYDDGTVPARPINLTGQFAEHQGAVLHWTDVAYNETKYKVFRATNINGPYTQINNDANTGNLTDYSDASAVPLTQYYYYVIASNATGNSLPSDTAGVLTGNNSPLINNLSDIFVKTESSVTEPFTVTDNAGDVVTVTAQNLPAFVTLQSMGGINYQLVATPGKEYIGLHTFTIVAKDNKGGSTSKTITVQVADKRTRSFFVNFGDIQNVAPTPWNNFTGFAYSGKQLLNLKDEAGVTSAISIRIDSSWSTTFISGHITGNNSGIYPDSVLQGGVLYDQNTPRRITFLGLNAAKKYNVSFISSNDGGATASADYSASGAVTSTLNARYNNHRVAYLNGLTPNASGNVQVTITKQSGSELMYLNGIVLEEYTDTVLLMNPIHLYAEVRDKTSIVLVWADRTNVENGYEVYRATDPAGTWTLVTTTSANVTTYTNTGLTANTKYYYRVRAKRNTGPAYSDYSNTEVVITPKSITYVNLTFTYPAASPWNNTNVNPDAGKSFPDLKNDLNQSTGITMTITKGFNGQNDAGMQTGSGIFPDAVMKSCYWLDRTQLGQFKLTGLNHTKRYRIGFFGSMGPAFEGNFTATYSIGNRTVYLNSSRNDSHAEYIGDVQPDENGEVLLNVSTIDTADFGFTTAIIIQSYDDVTGGTVLNAPNPGDGLITDVTDLTDNSPVAQALQPAVADEQGKQVRIVAYPNPFTDNVKIDFMNPGPSSQVSVDIVDLTGRLMYRKDAGRIPAGMNTLRLDVSNGMLTPGVYIVKLNIDGRVVNATRLVKARK